MILIPYSVKLMEEAADGSAVTSCLASASYAAIAACWAATASAAAAACALACSPLLKMIIYDIHVM